MAKRRQTQARTPEAMENHLINLAVKETEKRLINGTASSQILTLLLKLATTKAQLELEKLKSDIALQAAKEQEITEKANKSDLYEKAIAVFKTYSGHTGEDEEYEDDYL